MSNPQSGTKAKTQLVAQIEACLQSGDYSRAQQLLRGAAGLFPDDADLSQLEKVTQSGVERKAEADRLITQSQELFAQQKPAEAIELLRKAYDLDKKNSLARGILANALVEHAQAVVENDWLQAETLTNQALALNPAHPTARTMLNLIVRKKETSSVEDWVVQARKLQSSGDLFAALGWIAEGLAVHPHEPKLLLIQDEIQRDQETQRRQARRADVEDLRRMQKEIDGAVDAAAKQALAERIQVVAAKYWTDGEILSIANALLLRLGLVAQESSGTPARGKNATVILHVPRSGVPKAASPLASKIPASPAVASAAAAAPAPLPQVKLPEPAPPAPVEPAPVAPSVTPSVEIAPTRVASSVSAAPDPAASVPVLLTPAPMSAVPQSQNVRADIRTRIARRKAPGGSRNQGPKTTLATPLQKQPAPIAPEPSAVAPPILSAALSKTREPGKTGSTLVRVFAAITAAIMLVGATFLFTRKHYAPVAPGPAATVATPTSPAAASASSPAAPVVSDPEPAPVASSAPGVSAPAQPTAELSQPASTPGSGKVRVNNPPPVEASHNLGTLVVVTGQDDARVLLDGKLQPQLTRGGEVRLLNLEVRDYIVQVSKSGFKDPAPQRIRLRKGEEGKLVFNLQPQPLMAALAIQGGTPGTAVFVDQSPVGSIQPDGTLMVPSVTPGDHTVELRKERFKPRQVQKHFVGGGTISLNAAEAALEGVPGELKISFTPADATVAVVKGDLLKVVSSGVPLTLAPGTYTLTARNAERFTRSATVEVVAGQSKNLELSLAPNGMSKWDDPGAWKREKDAFIHKGGEFVLYGVVPASGTFIFSAAPAKGHLLQWVLNYKDSKNYVLFQLDDDNFYRAVIRNGQKAEEIKIPDQGDKRGVRTIRIQVSATELVHQIQHGDRWPVVDRWKQPGGSVSQGKFGFYIPGNEKVELSSFSHYADLNLR